MTKKPTKQDLKVAKKLWADTKLTQYVGTLSTGEPVFLSDASHLHKKCIPFVMDALSRIKSVDGPVIATTVDMGKKLGYSNVVPTVDGDEIYFAKRPGRKIVSRFVKNRMSLPTTKMAVVVGRLSTSFCLFTSYLGDLAVIEVAEAEAAKAANKNPAGDAELSLYVSKKYWGKHAFTEEAMND